MDVHERQCLRKWRVDNDKLPPLQRRPEPSKAHVMQFTGQNKLHLLRGQINRNSHLMKVGQKWAEPPPRARLGQGYLTRSVQVSVTMSASLIEIAIYRK